MDFYDELSYHLSPYPPCPLYAALSVEEEKARDQRRFRDLYPSLAGKIQPLVDEVCDAQEYDGSLMFDEYPDPLQIRLLSRRICERLDEGLRRDARLVEETTGADWLEDFVTVLLLNEMYQRRSRRKERRRSRYFLLDGVPAVGGSGTDA